MSETVIRVENLSKRYRLGAKESLPKTRRDAISSMLGAPFKYLRSMVQEPQLEEVFWALKEVSFEVKAGEVVGVIGRNGAGKSTLLKILSRITKPSSGYAEIRGRVGSLLEVGTGFHPELTGRENIYLNGAILGMRRWEIDKKFDEIVAFAEIDRFLDTPVKRYSSGMYVRLAFAVAAHLEPEILVVDEVLAVGDAEFQKKCLGKMGDVASKEGKTILFVSHNMVAVNRLCTIGLWLEQGSIHLLSSAEDAISAYLSTGAKIDGENRWESLEKAPGNDKIRLLAIRVLNQEKKISATINAQESFYIEMEYEIFKSIKGVRVGFFFVNNEGVTIFAPNDSENTIDRELWRQPGRYISRCQIQGKLLNIGTYHITASADIAYVESIYFAENLLRVQIERTKGSYSSRPDVLPGLICPDLNWQIEPIETPIQQAVHYH